MQLDLVDQAQLNDFTDKLEEIIANQNNNNTLSRLNSEFISQFVSLDSKHQMAWMTYGYKDTLTFIDFYSMYRRFGMAKSAVELAPTRS